MEHRENVGFILAYHIDNAVTPKDNFADILLTDLWYNPPRPWKRFETRDSREYPLYKHLRYTRSIARNKIPNGFQISQRLVRPSYACHVLIRFIASSWDMVSPAATCCKPLSIL